MSSSSLVHFKRYQLQDDCNLIHNLRFQISSPWKYEHDFLHSIHSDEMTHGGIRCAINVSFTAIFFISTSIKFEDDEDRQSQSPFLISYANRKKSEWKSKQRLCLNLCWLVVTLTCNLLLLFIDFKIAAPPRQKSDFLFFLFMLLYSKVVYVIELNTVEWLLLVAVFFVIISTKRRKLLLI